MKKSLALFLILFAIESRCYSQENFAKTLNLGLGIGYYSYANRSIPVLHVNYELDVASDFTLAPFITFYSYRNGYYWGNKQYPYRYYYYRETVIPLGIKGTYYFDKLLESGSKWDFYLASSLGFAIVSSSWDNGYYGDRNIYNGAGSLYFDFHVGSEYHFNNNIGMFIDLSSGVSTIGLAIH